LLLSRPVPKRRQKRAHNKEKIKRKAFRSDGAKNKYRGNKKKLIEELFAGAKKPGNSTAQQLSGVEKSCQEEKLDQLGNT